jgi:hypothetical protein
MKNKASLAVLLVEIIAIVVFHTTRSSTPDVEKPAATQAQSTNHLVISEIKQPILLTTLR